MFTKVPHANAPVELNYRIARDFEVDESADDADDKKDDKGEKDENNEKDDKTDAEKNAKIDKDTTQPPAKDVAKVDTKTPAGKTSKKLQKPKKQWSDGEHKRMWNFVIWCEKWDDIYGIENVSVSRDFFIEISAANPLDTFSWTKPRSRHRSSKVNSRRPCVWTYRQT